MCGNFGLLSLGEVDANADADEFKKPVSEADELEKALNASMHEVSRLHGLKEAKKSTAINDRNDNDAMLSENPEDLISVSPLSILQNQTSSTEIRGGQAGGYSSFEYKRKTARTLHPPVTTRVRMAARKRHPLAADLAAQYVSARHGQHLDPSSVITVIGHTRFATSSVNRVEELHPHEWTPFHPETVWQFDTNTGKLVRTENVTVGCHISHNGDFDALEAYSQPLVVDEVGLWLERVLYCPNRLRGDSPKIAGCMDLFRVQGRWAASARLAWIRIALNSVTDVSGNQQLSPSAPNTFPPPAYFEQWAQVFERVWSAHVNNVINASNGSAPFSVDAAKKNDKYTYTIDGRGLEQYVAAQIEAIKAEEFQPQQIYAPSGIEYFARGINGWSAAKLRGFVHYAVRGFLRSDTYTAMTEFLTRAEGSFGLQAHSTLEPGVVVIASKGQPMSFAFDPRKSIVLFGSEVEALSVPVYTTGQWLIERIDLDSHGEVVRLGEVRALQEGTFRGNKSDKVEEPVMPPPPTAVGAVRGIDLVAPPLGSPSSKPVINGLQRQSSVNATGLGRRPIGSPPPANLGTPTPIASPVSPAGKPVSADEQKKKLSSGLKLKCGVEIRSYSLVTCSEFSTFDLISRSVPITAAQIPFDPKVDLVAKDLSVIPAVLACIDRTWANSHSIERMAGQSLSESLVKCMKQRLRTNKDTTDLLISGVEASLWMAEQFAADLRVIFPQLNVVTLSANKLLGLGGDNPSKVFFPGADECLPRRIDENTCVLLISQSGQTFPTLHATRRVAKFAGDKLWLLTGCFNSKMELAMVDGYRERGKPYLRNRVFNNYSGNRPAEPATVAVAATWHTLTRLLLHIVQVARALFPAGRLVHPWVFDDSATTIQMFFRRIRKRLGRWKKAKADKKVKTFAEFSDEEGEEVTVVQRKGLKASVAHQVVRARKAGGKIYKIKDYAFDSRIVMNLTDGCIEDMTQLLLQTVVPQISQIVGVDQFGKPIHDPHGDGSAPLEDKTPHAQLVRQGHAWADHVNEPWHIAILVGVYMTISIGLGLPIFGLLGDLVVLIIRSAGGDLGEGTLSFTPRTPHVMYQQHVGWTLIGLALQIMDALWYVYLGWTLTHAVRLLWGRPLAARPGKRTIVIVDTPCVHQLLESFVSKLYASAYSNITVDVHGASGLDHFVHRFTHRVTRGVLIAVGRPDGRLCCLAKSEAAVLLAAKQAAFIRNPDYQCEGSGPEIVTVGHNPFQPNLGLAHSIVLDDGRGTGHSVRRQFVDEYLYERLFLTNKPFTTSMLRALRSCIKSKAQLSLEARARAKNKFLKNASPAVNTSTFVSMSMSTHKQKEQPLPYGAHHIDPSILIKSDKAEGSVFSDFVVTLMQSKQNKTTEAKVQRLKGQSYDPAVRLAFFSKLDSQTRQVQDLQVVVQQFYECRIASLERYLAFCVMFHAMASRNCRPWFKYPWDMAKSQSNLKIATTASPISAMNTHGQHTSQEVKKLAHNLGFSLRKFEVQF